jgi:hypothetical protein
MTCPSNLQGRQDSVRRVLGDPARANGRAFPSADIDLEMLRAQANPGGPGAAQSQGGDGVSRVDAGKSLGVDLGGEKVRHAHEGGDIAIHRPVEHLISIPCLAQRPAE